MASEEKTAAAATPLPSTSPQPQPSAADGAVDWKERILIPTLFGGVVGAGGGLLSKHRKAHGAANLCATYAANMAIIAAFYCVIDLCFVNSFRDPISLHFPTDLDGVLCSPAIPMFERKQRAREFVRKTRASEPDDLANSVIGGFASGAVLGRLQGGQLGALRYSIIFAIAGTAFDYATLRLRPHLKTPNPKWRLPEWSPIQVLDEEAHAAKRA